VEVRIFTGPAAVSPDDEPVLEQPAMTRVRDSRTSARIESPSWVV
jgi:hypothetical protein